MPGKEVTLVFQRVSQKGATWRYKEIQPGGVIGGFYLSKLAVFYGFDNRAPEYMTIIMEGTDIKPEGE
jgi:hypothetical protein